MIHILPATTIAHFETISRLAHSIWHEHYIKIISAEQIEYMLEKYNSVPHMTTRAKDGALYFYLTDNNVPVGYVGIDYNKDHLYISKLYVLKESRGKGIAKKVIQHTVALAKNQDIALIRLHVNKYNDNSIKFYKKMGFEITESVIEDIGQGFVMDDYVMAKTI